MPVKHQTYFKPARQNKFNARRAEYDGYYYMSGAEARYAKELDLMVMAHEIEGWDRQYKIDIRVKGKHITNHYVDFIIFHNDGSKEFREVKGYPSEAWLIKKRLVEATQNIPYTVIPANQVGRG